MPDTLTLPRLDDLHVHLRQDALAAQVAPLTWTGGAGRVLVMPNLRPALTTVEAVLAYRAALQAIEPRLDYLMSICLHPGLDRSAVRAAAAAGIRVLKWYPHGVTTNSSLTGSLSECAEACAAAQDEGLIVSLHGEAPDDPAQGIDRMNAEQAFLPQLVALHQRFPRLRIIFEHATSAAAISTLADLGPTVAATITPHHLLLTADDWQTDPHSYCKPVAKTAADRAALQAVVASGDPRYFLGSDSAPHPAAAKAGNQPAAGIFTAPILAPLLADIFDTLGCLDQLPAFATTRGAAFYDLPPTQGRISLQRRPSRIPAQINGLIPLRAGHDLKWTLGACKE